MALPELCPAPARCRSGNRRVFAAKPGESQTVALSRQSDCRNACGKHFIKVDEIFA